MGWVEVGNRPRGSGGGSLGATAPRLGHAVAESSDPEWVELQLGHPSVGALTLHPLLPWGASLEIWCPTVGEPQFGDPQWGTGRPLWRGWAMKVQNVSAFGDPQWVVGGEGVRLTSVSPELSAERAARGLSPLRRRSAPGPATGCRWGGCPRSSASWRVIGSSPIGRSRP